jgi:hypothetical protein
VTISRHFGHWTRRRRPVIRIATPQAGQTASWLSVGTKVVTIAC